MLQKRGATRGTAMAGCAQRKRCKASCKPEGCGGWQAVGATATKRGGTGREAGMGTGGGRRRKATWLKRARWDGVFAQRVEGWWAAHVCVAQGVEQSAVAKSSLGNVRCQQQQENLQVPLPPRRTMPGWQLGGPKLHSFYSGPAVVQQLMECHWTNQAVRSLSISNCDYFLLTTTKHGVPSWVALRTLPCNSACCSRCLLMLFLSVLQLQLLHHLHKGVHCG